MALTLDTGAIAFHFALESFSSPAICVTGDVAPARVGCAWNNSEKYLVFALSSTTARTVRVDTNR